jgi:hypothetical protein
MDVVATTKKVVLGLRLDAVSRKRRRGELILKEELLDSLVTTEAGLFPIDKRTVSGQTPRGRGGLLLSQQLGHMIPSRVANAPLDLEDPMHRQVQENHPVRASHRPPGGK